MSQKYFTHYTHDQIKNLERLVRINGASQRLVPIIQNPTALQEEQSANMGYGAGFSFLLLQIRALKNPVGKDLNLDSRSGYN